MIAACSRSGPDELLETARFEELQRNVPHARKLYAEIVEKHPDSPQAAEARKRLAVLDAGSEPTPP
jgi:TolA-binding protein